MYLKFKIISAGSISISAFVKLIIYFTRQHTNFLYVIFPSYKWKHPTLEKHFPQVTQQSPLEAAGKLYTIGQISSQPKSSFQVNT
jgi:hypothetical protein